ncbi:MAG: magnesium chelatase subunit, partial [Pyrinomonadaceae bacterium]|nr:magnesium chelatase subunit [Pyrinomonadaceae bacterium]
GVAELCMRLGVDGHRGELTIARAARALAAFESRKEVMPQDVRRVAAMALRHRLRRDPLEQTSGGSELEQAAQELFGAGDDAEAAEPGATGTPQRPPKKTPPDETGGNNGGGNERRDPRRTDDARASQAKGEERPAPPLDARLPDSFDEKPGINNSPAASTSRARRRANSRTTQTHTRGRYTRAVARRADDLKIALDATLRVAAASQWSRRRDTTPLRAIEVETADLRYKHFSRRAGTLFIFAVDTSGSMALNRIAQAKGALARLLRESYVNRDRVALITFRERAARVLLQPGQSGARARRLLDALPVGGATPLSSGLLRALEMSERAARQGTGRIVLLVFTDGRANVPRDGKIEGDRAGVRRQIKSEVEKIGVALQRTGVASVVVDTQNRFTSGGEGQRLAQALGGRYVHLPALK